MRSPTLVLSNNSLGLVRGEAGDGHHFGLCPTWRLQQASSGRFSKWLWGTISLSCSGTYANTQEKGSHSRFISRSECTGTMARIWRSDDNLKKIQLLWDRLPSLSSHHTCQVRGTSSQGVSALLRALPSETLWLLHLAFRWVLRIWTQIDLLDLKLKSFGSCSMWMLRSKLSSSARAASTHNHGDVPLALIYVFIVIIATYRSWRNILKLT